MLGRPKKDPVAVIAGVELWLCTCCEEPLPGSRFGPNSNTSNGLSSWCQKCHREAARFRRVLGGRGPKE